MGIFNSQATVELYVVKGTSIFLLVAIAFCRLFRKKLVLYHGAKISLFLVRKFDLFSLAIFFMGQALHEQSLSVGIFQVSW